jgi:hypothetical protein
LSSVWWLTLNGFWDYSISRMDEAYDALTAKKLSWNGKIRVPYPLESQLSHVGSSDIKLEPKQFLWYRRSFRLSPTTIGTFDGREGNSQPSSTNTRLLRYYINFEAVDYACKVWVNDIEVRFYYYYYYYYCYYKRPLSYIVHKSNFLDYYFFNHTLFTLLTHISTTTIADPLKTPLYVKKHIILINRWEAIEEATLRFDWIYPMPLLQRKSQVLETI